MSPDPNAPNAVVDISNSDLVILEKALVIEAGGHIWAIRDGENFLAGLGTLHGSIATSSMADGLGTIAAANGRTRQRSVSGVAVVPLKGIITPQPSLLSLLFGGGGGGLMTFRDQLRQAAANPDVSHIVLDVDSPGGLVDMVPEVAQDIRDAGEQKPIVAVANTLAASAAYWLASQAHEVVVTPSGEVGSVGTYLVHMDQSRMLDQQGVTPTIVQAGKHKSDGNPFSPLSDDAQQSMQNNVDDYYGMFVSDVATGRGVEPDPEAIQNGMAFGGGKTFLASRAKRAGLVDRVATLEETISRLASGKAKVARTAADDTLSGSDHRIAAIHYSPEDRRRMVDTLA